MLRTLRAAACQLGCSIGSVGGTSVLPLHGQHLNDRLRSDADRVRTDASASCSSRHGPWPARSDSVQQLLLRRQRLWTDRGAPMWYSVVCEHVVVCLSCGVPQSRRTLVVACLSCGVPYSRGVPSKIRLQGLTRAFFDARTPSGSLSLLALRSALWLCTLHSAAWSASSTSPLA